MRLCCRGFAPAGATRGLCGRPLHPFAAHTPISWIFMLLERTKSTLTNTISKFTCAICLRLFRTGVRSFHLACTATLHFTPVSQNEKFAAHLGAFSFGNSIKNFRLKSSNIRRGRRSSPEGDRKALWSLPQERNPCDNQNQHKIISIRKKSRWTCNLHLLFSYYLTSSQNLSMFPLTTSRLERQKSGFRTSIPTLAATSAIVPEPQERSRRQ